MRVLVSAYEARGCVERMEARTLRPRALGGEGRASAPADEGCDPLMMRGVMPVGVWR